MAIIHYPNVHSPERCKTVNGAKYFIGFFSKHVTMHDEQKADVKLDQETYALLTSLTKQLNLTYTLQLR